jgi:dTDP-4-dehydrorhamnose 3,5-epimerase-like enzyme
VSGFYRTAKRTFDTHRNYGVFLAIAGENWLSVVDLSENSIWSGSLNEEERSDNRRDA